MSIERLTDDAFLAIALESSYDYAQYLAERTDNCLAIIAALDEEEALEDDDK